MLSFCFFNEVDLQIGLFIFEYCCFIICVQYVKYCCLFYFGGIWGLIVVLCCFFFVFYGLFYLCGGVNFRNVKFGFVYYIFFGFLVFFQCFYYMFKFFDGDVELVGRNSIDFIFY